jgi:hypothetical protein
MRWRPWWGGVVGEDKQYNIKWGHDLSAKHVGG